MSKSPQEVGGLTSLLNRFYSQKLWLILSAVCAYFQNYQYQPYPVIEAMVSLQCCDWYK